MSGECTKFVAINEDTGEYVETVKTNSEDAYERLLEKLGFHVVVEEEEEIDVDSLVQINVDHMKKNDMTLGEMIDKAEAGRRSNGSEKD